MSGAQLPVTPQVAGDAFDDCSIAEYYTKKEMAEMSAYQIKTLKNMKRNYLMLHSLGLPVNKPNFMKTPAVKKRQLRVVESDSDSDEEWRPTSKTKNKNAKPFKIPMKFFGEHTNKVAQAEKKSSFGKRRKATQGTISDRSAPSYPKRNRPITNYMDIEVPDDDSFLYCEECNKEYPGDCPDHGPLHVIQDKETKNLKQSMLTAEASLPDCVVVKSSSIPNAGLGVFATCPIKSRTRFGPYKGVKIRDVDEAHSTGYAWQIYSDGKPGHYVDASDPKHSNWMRYVNCARSDMEQNLTAFQYKGEVYYRSHQDIAPGQELLVWYGADYGSELGIHKPVLLNKSQGGPYSTVSKTGEVTYGCGRCPYIQFVGEKYLVTHMKYKHRTILPPDWNSRQQDNVEPQNVNGKTMKDQNIYQELLNNELEDVTLSHLNINNSSRTRTEYVALECARTDGKYMITGVNCNIVPVKLKTDQKTFQDMSEYRCSQKGDQTKHIRTNNGEKLHQCTMCDARFSQKGDLTVHIRTHTGEKPYQCTVCDARFSQKGHLTNHIRTHTGEKPYQCTMCDARFSEKGDLTGHIRSHTGEKPYHGTMCDARFSEKGDLTVHIRTHTGEKPYQCTMCDARFSHKSNLTAHIRTHTGEEPYQCTMCDARFSLKGNLTVHIRTHTGEKPYQCTMCDARFSLKGNLTRHIRTHTGEEPFQCTMCDARFNQKVHLTRHIRTHTGEEPYQCTMCDARFSQKGDLTKHIRTHTGEKPYQCTMCDARFSQKGPLTVHIRTHTGEKPYQCTMCDARFSVKCHLTVHNRTHTGEKPYQCTMCEYRCANRSSLTYHMVTRHGVTKTKGLRRSKAATTPPVTSCGSGAETDKQAVEKPIGLEE